MLIHFQHLVLAVQCYAIDLLSIIPLIYSGGFVYAMSFVESVKHEKKPVSVFRRVRKITTGFRRT